MDIEKGGKQRGDTIKTLDILGQRVRKCHECALSLTRTNVVFGSGNYLSDLVVIGEGPGADEDREGFPFLGKAGTLLLRQLETIGRDKTNTYLCNVVKCRACDVTGTGWKQNRTPHFDEIESCEGYLTEQVQALPNVRLIVAVGSCPAHWVLGQQQATSRLGQMRGKFFNTRLYRGLVPIPGIVTYHPSYLLRKENATYKASVWEDWKLVRKYFQVLNSGKDPFEDTFPLLSASQAIDKNRPDEKYQTIRDTRPWGKLRSFQTDRWTTKLESL